MREKGNLHLSSSSFVFILHLTVHRRISPWPLHRCRPSTISVAGHPPSSTPSFLLFYTSSMGVVRTYESRRSEIEEFRRMIAGDLRSKSFAGDPVPPSSSKSPRKTTSITGE
ncbi:hypothetical protein HanRHA438_Chr03g0109511 [Helianthus annuus]|nr:hypothetical protein HanHA300_Chr03g0081961 [Helianthus annuus]KAJ0599674.1 hypothetical protein HanIR_Chr03g0107511 [Helianthus annuus]KAJ0607180.1 hypothetical protein HanHA89_Chr03g0093481 [Helianthus annuus]KAJ0767239.1 hypothetical protein HanLR1_Chr03g0086771 [Helianthus annuus]KAJ0773087.1 hypothetical protein HanOQP8_Chr03g0094821 [Helianthus annuus]